MGFEVSKSSVRLEFAEGTLLSGATVQVSTDMSVRDFINLQRSLGALSKDGSGDEWQRTYALFGESYLESWDLVRNGEPLTADAEGMLSLPIRVASELFNAWVQALVAPAPNLRAASANGVLSEAELATMGLG